MNLSGKASDVVTTTLDQFELGQEGEIVHLDDNEYTAKLIDMGLFPGKRVKMLMKAPLGDPVGVDVEGYTLSLRLKEASSVFLKSV
ncbi:MAG: ferrous iron transport protein A [Cytophagales bacterium]|nr:ferrous iron transport protein A [Cytophagales bacterium]